MTYRGYERGRRDALRRYGLTPEQYDAMRAAQGFCCALCGRHEDALLGSGGRPRKDGAPPAPSTKLVVDHCHRTQRVRGLLCVGCNQMLRRFDKDPERFIRIADYLRG